MTNKTFDQLIDDFENAAIRLSYEAACGNDMDVLYDAMKQMRETKETLKRAIKEISKP